MNPAFGSYWSIFWHARCGETWAAFSVICIIYGTIIDYDFGIDVNVCESAALAMSCLNPTLPHRPLTGQWLPMQQVAKSPTASQNINTPTIQIRDIVYPKLQSPQIPIHDPKTQYPTPLFTSFSSYWIPPPPQPFFE